MTVQAEELVSIIIPVYNSEKYLAQAIRSAIDQTYSNKEIIIIDDGSIDGSLAIARSFESSTVKVFDQVNQGASAARNHGLRQAKGAYIQFLDADDLLSPDKIALQVEGLAGRTDLLAVCSTVHFKDGEDHLQSEPSVYEEKFLYSTDDPVGFMVNLWGGNDLNASMVQPNAWLTPKALIDRLGSWDEQLSWDDDGEFFARMVLNSKGIVRTGGLNYYRKFPAKTNNLSSKKSHAGLQSGFDSLMLKKQYLFEKTSAEPAKKAIYRQLMELAPVCYLAAPDIYRHIEQELRQLPRYKFKVVLGGSLLNFISGVFGWRAGKKVQQLYYKLKGI